MPDVVAEDELPTVRGIVVLETEDRQIVRSCTKRRR